MPSTGRSRSAYADTTPALVVAAKRLDQIDPRLLNPETFDPQIARRLWDSLPEECRRDSFGKSNMPDQYRAAVVERSAGAPWSTIALNLRDLPETMLHELAWLLHREVQLGRSIYPDQFNSVTRALRLATSNGSRRGRAALSILSLSPEQWGQEIQAARLRGSTIGGTLDAKAVTNLRRLQNTLCYPYHRGLWWQLDLWNPVLDPRVPRREHEPLGRYVANFDRLTSAWLREAAKWWLAAMLESERYSWSTIKVRLDGLKWLQRHINDRGDAGPLLVTDPHELSDFFRGLAERLRTHLVLNGPRKGQPLAAMPRRQTMVTIEQFYQWMYDNRVEAAQILAEPAWVDLRPEYTVPFRLGDKPRLTNTHAEDGVLDDAVMAQIAAGSELLAVAKADGGLGDRQAFHALALQLRTGRRVNEILMMDFDPLLTLLGGTGGAEEEGDVPGAGLVAPHAIPAHQDRHRGPGEHPD